MAKIIVLPTTASILSHITPDGIALIADKLAERLIAYAHESWTNFIDEDGEISIDEDGQVTRELEYLLPAIGESIYDRLFNHPTVDAALTEMKIIVKDCSEDANEWHLANQSHDAMLRYHGMSRSDFS